VHRIEPLGPIEQFLGEIETEVVVHRHHQAGILPGQSVELQREPENPDDAGAIRVDVARFQPLGYIARSAANWLAPLIDAGEIRIEGYIAARFQPARDATLPLVVMVFLQSSGHNILESQDRPVDPEALHQLAVEAFHKAQSLADAESLRQFINSLEPLRRRNLLPQTHLLLALLPSMVNELRAAANMQTLATLHESLSRLSIGAPIDHRGLTLYPLSWPSDSEPPYLLFSQALQHNLAATEEVREAPSGHRLRVYNQSDQPILIPEGEILTCGRRNRMVGATTLAGPRSTVTLPAARVQPGRRQRSLPLGGSASPAPLPSNCAGVAAVRSARVIGVDLFDCAGTFQALWDRFAPLRLPGARGRGGAAERDADSALLREFFQSVAGHARVRAPASGLGEKVQIGGEELLGSALFYAGRVCHLAAFHIEEGAAV
jgi:hypothetical protein